MTNKITVGDKVKVVNSSEEYYYTNGATGIVLEIDGTAVVQFTDGKYKRGFGDEWYVRLEELEVISNESKTQTKKEKEVGNQIKMKQGVYAVVDAANGEVLAVDTVREDARSSLQRAKSNGVNAKLVKMQPQKWVR